MHSVAVVVPVYKEKLSQNEKLSLDQCREVFKDTPVIFVSAEGFFPDYLQGVAADRRVFFEGKYFSSIDGYNRLMLYEGFYSEFKEYEYILIYQLDAFVFRNELQYWCEQQYDYIGAPLISDGRLKEQAVNGGFSLRRTSTFIELLRKRNTRYRNIGQFLDATGPIAINALRFPLAVLRYFNKNNLVGSFLDSPNRNEDLFYSSYGSNIIKYFKVADPSAAIRFAFEKSPSVLFSRNQERLPFGCHAFEMYEPDFWKKYIPFE